VGVPEVELEQLLKGMALYGLNVHKVRVEKQRDLSVTDTQVKHNLECCRAATLAFTLTLTSSTCMWRSKSLR
jgi:hypothetical protein